MSVASARYRVHVRRGAPGRDEAVHQAVCVSWRPGGDGPGDGADGAEGRAEDAGLVTFFRSACKPFQALPLVERGHAERFGFGAPELAVMSASHNGAAEHVAVVRGMLERIGLTDRHLLCGFHYPEDPENDAALRKGALTPSPVYNNCSGKHTGMLALAVAEGWPVEDYVSFDHPVQRACVAAVAEVCGVDARSLPLGVDGCSAANPAVPLSAMARGFSRFALAKAGSTEARERGLAQIRAAMIEHPRLVAGEGRLCTDVLTAGAGAVITKTGAEGLQCLGFPRTGEGVAVKVLDGTRRAVGPAVLAYLRDGERLSAAALAALERWAHPSIKNHRGLVVGELRAEREAADLARAEPATTTARAR
jgi:L-asparaginase II